MRYLFDYLQEITAKMQDKKLIVFFDFDLTLSPLAQNPQDAFLPDDIRNSLRELSTYLPVSIISGRDISDLHSRIRLPELNYAGNHGLEWQIQGKRYAVDIPKETLQVVFERLQEISEHFPGTFLERKALTAALHYRELDPQKIPALEEELRKISPENIKIRWSKMAFDISPKVNWDKGSVCLAIIHATDTENRLPLYIGDDLTDEDAFRDLDFGITVRVGKNAKSKAKYYLKNQQEITKLLEWLLQSVRENNR